MIDLKPNILSFYVDQIIEKIRLIKNSAISFFFSILIAKIVLIFAVFVVDIHFKCKNKGFR